MRRKPPPNTDRVDGRVRELSAALERETEMRRASERLAARVERLFALTAALSDAATTGEVLDAALDRLREHAGVSAVLISLAEQDRLVVHRAEGFSDAFVQEFNAGAVEPAHAAVERRKPVVVRDGDAALATIPLPVRDRVLGVVALRFGPVCELAADEIEFLDAIGRQCAQAFERARLLDSEREARRALAREHAYMQAVVEQMPAGVSIAEAPSGKLVVHNSEAARLLRHSLIPSGDYTGYSQYGALHDVNTPYKPEEYPMARALWGENVRDELMLYSRGDGSLTDLMVNAAPVRDANGQVIAAVTAFQDVSELTRTQRKLREINERLSRVLESTTDSVFTLDRDWRITYMNRRASDTIAAGRDLTGQVLWGVFPEGVGSVFEREYRTAMETGAASHFEAYYPPLGILFEVHAYPEAEAGLVVFFRDITKRKQSEEALRRSEALYRAVAQNIPNGGVFVIDRDLRVLVAEGDLAVRFGYGPQCVEGRELSEVLDERMSTIVEPRFRRALAGEHAAYETDHEGTIVSSQYVPLRDEAGRVVAAMLLTLDITERKRTEQAIEEARAQLMAVFQGMTESVAIVDYERLILANDAFIRTHGFGASYYTEVMRPIEVRSITGELVPMEEWPSARALRGEAVHQVELQLRRTDTGRSWIGSYSAAPVRDANGNVVQAVVTMRDITEQKRAEQALRDSEERLRLAQVCANVGVWDRDMQTGAVNFTPELYGMYGLPQGSIATYEQWRALVHPDDIGRIEADLGAALGRHEPFESEFRVFHSSGEIRWINAKGGGIFDDAGNVVRLLGVNIDITDRKLAEYERERLLEMLAQSASEARRNRAQLEAVFQAMQDGVVVFDMTGAAVFINQAGAGTSGFTIADMEKPLAWYVETYELTDPDGTLLPVESWPVSRALRGESFTDLELCARRRDTGQSWFFTFSGAPVYGEDGSQVLAVVITRDVTERERREQELREVQERLARTQEFSLVMALHVGLDGTWLKVPPTFVRFLGYDTEDELVGRHFKDFTHPDDFGADWSQVLQLLRGEIRSFEMEKRFLRKDGSAVWGYINCSIVTDAQGRPVHLLTYVRDINAQKRAEHALRESEARLKTVIENLAEGIIVFDPDGYTMQFNRAALQMHGYSHQEKVLGHLTRPFLDLIELSTLDGKVLPLEQWPIPRLLRGEDLSGWELRLRNRQTGWQRVFSHNGAIVRDEEGRPVMGLLSLRDITEQKQAERAIRESEQQYKTLAENAPEVIARFDRRFRHTYVNEYGAKVYGLPKEAVIGKTNAELGMPADKVAFWRSQFEEVLKTGKQRTVDFEFDSPTFGHQYFSSISVPEFDETGAVGSVLAITRDVTALKTTEQALRDSQSRLELALDSAELGTWDIDVVTGDVIATPRMHAIFGIGPARHRSAFVERLHPDDRERVETELKKAEAALSTYEFEFRIVRPGGELRWGFTKGIVIADSAGRAARRIGIVQDITERKRAEDALRDSERWFRELAELLPQLVWVTRPDGHHIYFNHRWYEQIGVREQESLGERWADILHPDDRERTLTHWHHCLETGEPYEIEYRFRVANGEYRWFLGRAMPVRDEAGRTLRWFGTCTDIEDAKRAEQRARDTQKLESIGLLAGGIAHDFNNLLTGILGNASLVLDEVGPNAAARVQSIVNGAERAAHLTRQLLAYSGKGQFFVKDLDLSQSVREMADLLHLSLPKTVELRLDLQQRLPLVAMDPGQLQQIVMNLVINAGEAIGEGRRGRITVSTGVRDIDRPFVDALGSETKPGRYIYLEVADTGQGMDEATRSKIFDPFFTTKFTGRGLGLAAVSGIVRSQQGVITVDSRPGQGTTFTVLFPVSERMPGKTPEQAAGGLATVLVVDDEESVRDFIREVLRREGYSVLLASDGREALALWETNQDRIDAAIIDIIMPVMGGNDLLQQLKALRPDLRVLLTSGYSEAEVRRLCAKYGDTKFIQKPYTAQALAQAVASLVS